MSEDVTQLLQNYSAGEPGSENQLYGLVMNELKRIATAYMRRERAHHTLQPTALVNEAYLKLIDQNRVEWQSRAHFYGIAANIMRRILVDHARSKSAVKRGGEVTTLCLDDHDVADVGLDQPDLLALEDALDELSQFSKRQATVVELKFYGGLNVEEIAAATNSSPATVKRDWAFAKAWLHDRLSGR